jgi:hypothetical protein
MNYVNFLLHIKSPSTEGTDHRNISGYRRVQIEPIHRFGSDEFKADMVFEALAVAQAVLCGGDLSTLTLIGVCLRAHGEYF